MSDKNGSGNGHAAEAQTVAKVDRLELAVDVARYEMLEAQIIATKLQLAALERDFAAAKKQRENRTAAIRDAYHLGDGDMVSLTDGTIVRQHKG